MQKAVHRLNNKISQPSEGSRNIFIELRPNEVDSTGEPRISTTTFNFAYNEAKEINAHLESGAAINGNGVGIHEGIQHSISVKDDDGELLIFDGYLVTSGAQVVYSKESIKNIKSELRGKIESLSKRAKAVYFSDLLEEKRINPVLDYVIVPYIINSIPSYKEAAIVTITAFMVINNTRTMVKEVAKALADIAGILSAIAGVIKVVLLIAWIIIVIAQIIILIQDIFDHIIQPIKYHNGMLWKRLLEIAAAKLGYTVSSTIFEQKEFIDTVRMPAKFEAFEDVNNKISLGFTRPNTIDSTGYYAGNFYELLKETKATFRASIVITDDNVMIIEPISRPTQSPVAKLPNIKRLEHQTNASELRSNYTIGFKLDSTEDNTKKAFTGTFTSAITTALRENDPFANTLDTPNAGAFEVLMPFARAARKNGLTNIEQGFHTLFKAVSPAINTVVIVANILILIRNTIMNKIQKVLDKLKVVGINIPFNPKVVSRLPLFNPDIIKDRIGMLMIEKDAFDVPKVMALDIASSPRQTKLKILNNIFWHSEFIYQRFHAGQSHAITDEFPFGNQERIYKSGGFHLCKETAEQILRNNRIFTHDGLTARITSLKWNIETGIVESIEYRIPHVDTRNLKTVLITPHGI